MDSVSGNYFVAVRTRMPSGTFNMLYFIREDVSNQLDLKLFKISLLNKVHVDVFYLYLLLKLVENQP